MEAINEGTKLIAQALDKLNFDAAQTWGQVGQNELAVKEAILLLESALEKIVKGM